MLLLAPRQAPLPCTDASMRESSRSSKQLSSVFRHKAKPENYYQIIMCPTAHDMNKFQ